MEEKTKNGYVKFADLSEEQKEEALALRKKWSDEILFWVEDGHVYKCSQSVGKKHEDKDSLHKI